MNQIPGLADMGEEVLDVEEEAFLLFAQEVPSNNLGMIDPRAPAVEIPINGKDYTIHQSPSLLSSHRAGGTTGAVLWKITPRFAEWITNPKNPLWSSGLLDQSSTVVELGTGISALVALSLAPLLHHYIATDQEYVHKLFRTNLDANAANPTPTTTSNKKSKSKGSKSKPKPANPVTNISFTTLDWETDQAGSLKEECLDSVDEDKGFDLLLSCDCIYNEALVAPFVRTCAEICRLRPAYGEGEEIGSHRPTVCIIAQQQRSPDVFETWLRETMRDFRVWRLSDEVLGEGLRSGSGYLVHLLLVK
ncbi:unnamed protein product [Penicillium salamii]|uniref:Diaminohydroxyphosphoribosylamino-pyrimidine deaminase n=1 Tax=Penicillium salamii TaxID=1612424 RepID=A0A9W4J5R8_9EURO|nr:unnamed protein product [Penicillium salamii]CAG8301930.1 unnamed protein product [Penicillium salamii]CAG8371551.1 unnamed protein product [Penicillium salamii]CAG8376482.1 unnamed protein product [Penicillium salamii]CAG8377597.1 unnamed protein product [Penicillium salamii]